MDELTDHRFEQAQDPQNITVQTGGITFHIRITQLNFREVYIDETARHIHIHRHNTWELQYIYSGEMKFYLSDEKSEMTIRQGQLLVIPPNIPHNVGGSNPVSRLCFRVMVEFDHNAKEFHSSNLYWLSRVFSDIREPKLLENRQISNLMEMVAESHYPSQFPIKLQQDLLLPLVITHAFSLLSLHEKHPERKEPQLKFSQQQVDWRWIIDDHVSRYYNQDSSLESLAKKLFLSVRQTRTVIKKLTGKNYKELILGERMKMANNLLATPNIPLTEIAYLVGYKSYSGFYVAYTGLHGINPEEARNQLLRTVILPDVEARP